MNKGKSLFITGISSDVGMSLVRKIINNYEIIIGQYRTHSENLESLKQEFGDKLILIQADLSVQAEVDKMVNQLREQYDVIDHIVHLASIPAQNLQFRKENWSHVSENLDVSVRAIYNILQALLPAMVKQKYGKIVFMLSSYVIGVPPKYQSTYIVSKYALLGLMNSLASEYSESGITFNGVSPDMIETKFLRGLPHIIIEQNAQNSKLKRNLTVEDVIPSFEKLLSDESDNITGRNYEIRNRV